MSLSSLVILTFSFWFFHFVFFSLRFFILISSFWFLHFDFFILISSSWFLHFDFFIDFFIFHVLFLFTLLFRCAGGRVTGLSTRSGRCSTWPCCWRSAFSSARPWTTKGMCCRHAGLHVKRKKNDSPLPGTHLLRPRQEGILKPCKTKLAKKKRFSYNRP